MIPKRIAAKSPIRFCYKVLPLVELVTKCRLSVCVADGPVCLYFLEDGFGIDIREKDDNVTERGYHVRMVNEGR
ncbi:MAG: hypothetical protein ACLUAR_16845 [Pilosibacter sp.]